MKCVIPTCDNDSSHISSQQTTYFKFPMEQSVRAAWLEILHKRSTDWQPQEDTVICSKHFLPENILESNNGLQTLRMGAVPVVNVQVCRICFAMDCKLYQLTKYKILYETYEKLSGILIESDNIPPYLCDKCSHQLLKCARFRTKSLEAHAILAEIITKHNFITRESILSVQGIQNPLHSNDNCRDFESYDIDMEIAEIENMNSTNLTNATPIPSMVNDSKVVNDDIVKTESTEVQQYISSCTLTNDVMVYILVSEESLPEETDADCKEEDNDMLNQTGEELKRNNRLEDNAVDDTPQLDDESPDEHQHIKQNTKDGELIVAAENRNLTKKNSLKKLKEGDTVLSNENTRSENCTKREKRKNAKQIVQEVLDITNVSQHCIEQPVPPRTSGVEGEKSSDVSLTLEEVSRQKEATDKEIEDVAIILASLGNTNGDIHGNLDGMRVQEIGKLYCDKCQFQTISKIQMSSHLKAHAASKSFNCTMCSYKTIHKRSLVWHTRVHSREKPYACDKCNKKFSQRGALLVHKRQHSGTKPYSCKICKRKFSEMSTLRRHLIIHTGEKPFKCDICNKTFRQTSHLKNHLRIHAGEKPYICDYCQKAFGQKSHLIKHMRIHTDGLQYACRICDKILRHDLTLKNHMRKHYDEKSYSCELCKKVFSKRSSLKVHIMKHIV